MDADGVLETALEAGVLDVQDDADGRVVAISEPNETRAVGETISKALGMEISSSEIVYVPEAETVVPLQDGEAAANIAKFVEDMHAEDSTIQGVYMNIARGEVEEDAWEEVLSKVSV